MRLYLSGGMTNIPNFNFDLFDEVERDLVAQGIQIDSPAQHDRQVVQERGRRCEDIDGFAEGDVKRYGADAGIVTEDLFVWDFQRVIADDGIVMLPGWETSTGARHERYIAEALGKPVYYAIRVGGQSTLGRWIIELDEFQQRLVPLLARIWPDRLPVEEM